MPILKASKKAVRKDEKRRKRNELYRASLKKALDFAKKDNYSEEKVKEAVKIIDKLESKGILHKNTAARRKSKLMAKLNAARKEKQES